MTTRVGMAMKDGLKTANDSRHRPRHVVVVGSSGRLGSSLMGFLEPDCQVTGLGRGELDLGSARSVRQALEPLDYDMLFLTAALTDVDYCENHAAEAFEVNGEGPGRIAEISARKGAHVTYISTDMVFDGSKETTYDEADTPNPLSVYGASKLEGEQRVLGASRHNLVARVSWVFGPNRPAFPEWIIRKACESPRLQLPENKTGCPTYTLDLVRWLAALVPAPADGPASGLFHLCNAGPCNWREWGQFAIDTAREAGIPVITGKIEGVPLDSVTGFIAKRPLNSAMGTDKFTTLTGIRPREWKAAMRDFVLQNRSFSMYKSLPVTS